VAIAVCCRRNILQPFSAGRFAARDALPVVLAPHDVYAVRRVSARFLALDLGAESGRAILGRLDGEVLTLKDVRRFPNVAVRTHGSLHWDILRLWHEVKASLDDLGDVTLDSVGLDTWGCDYALLGEQGQLLENPYHYRDTRTDEVPSEVFRQVSAERIYATTGIQFLNFNSLFQLYSASRSTPNLLRAATAFVTIPDLLNYWLRPPRVRVHHCDHHTDD
jgi:rhamnulokinase